MATTTITTYDGEGNVVEERTLEVPPEQTNAESLQTKILDQITRAEAVASTQAAWAALAAAQKDEALRRTVLMVAKLGRFLLQRFDSD